MTAVVRPRVCRHCLWRALARPRGLCNRCHRTPAVRALFPIPVQCEGHGTRLGTSPRPLPAEPTTARPGSRAKMAVLTARAAAGATLWHPLDRD